MRFDFAFPEPRSTNRSSPRTTKPEPWPWGSLLVDFITCGFTEELFWSLTPRQIETHFAAARKRARIERNMMMETAYLAAIVPHQKKPPKLVDLLVPVDDKPRMTQTPEQRLAAAAAWAAAMARR